MNDSKDQKAAAGPPLDCRVMPLPCPFCGSTSISTYDGSTFRWMYAGCDECGAQAGEVRIDTLGTDREAARSAAQIDAITEWNKRHNYVLDDK